MIFPPGLLSGMNLYLLLLALFAWICSKESFDKNLLRVIAPFFLIIIIGLAVGSSADRYIFLKDLWYVSNAPIIISVGYVLYRCMPDLGSGLRAFVIAGTLLSLLYLANFAIHPDLFNLSTVALREVAGTGYYAPALAFTILFAYRGKWLEALKLPRWLAIACLVICALAITASFSRTIVIVTLIGVLASSGAFVRREALHIGVILVVSLLVIGILRMGIDVDSNEASTTFLGKIARSTDELTIQEYTDLKSINYNWRGYETARAWRYYSSGSVLGLAMGQGFGAEVDLGLFMPLGSGSKGERVRVRLAPVLHNGFAYLLVKGGVVAIGLFCFVLVSLYRIGRKKAASVAKDYSRQAARVMQATAITLTFTTWLIAGVFNKLDLFPFMLVAGFLLAALTRNEDEAT
ncbi:hypothetical protein RGU75_16795 [Glaciimonas sp. CA11.2]|uniref:hypothetical protein n=2 Tax=Glaciimonas sp. CA11.2 TaxID=3048601 RepID=UPI002AB52B2E|nr:hypothetical protein [Glaciimonas sp. CA11.2]MDY7547881.1 hypothetical protein [Glaciimonas sp. CA11.2]